MELVYFYLAFLLYFILKINLLCLAAKEDEFVFLEEMVFF